MLTNVRRAETVMEEVNKVILGKENAVRKVMAAILAKGHVLIEDVPGVGKTEMALAFSKAMDLTQNRIQFTPDVLPSDIVGFNMYQKQTGQFVYQPGVVMCNLLLADEINRTSPKTQSALLEVMEEGTVTVEGVTRQVPTPFIVIATQNPVGSYGTQRLPESQMDRFIISITMGYPDANNELRMLKERHDRDPMEQVRAVIDEEELKVMQQEAESVFVHDLLYSYIVDLSEATRRNPHVQLGLSPRGTLALCKIAKAYAYLEGREYVLPDDVKAVLPDVAVHRIVLTSNARMSAVEAELVIEQVMDSIKAPQLIKRPV